MASILLFCLRTNGARAEYDVTSKSDFSGQMESSKPYEFLKGSSLNYARRYKHRMTQRCSLWTYKPTFFMQHGEKGMKHSWAFILGCIHHMIRPFKRRNSSALISVLLNLGLVKNPITPTSGPFLPHCRPFAPAVVCPNCDTKAGERQLRKYGQMAI